MSTEQIETVTAPAPPYAGAGYIVPTHNPEGVALTPQEQRTELGKIPEFRDKYLASPHSVEARILDDLNRKAAGVAPLAPPIGPGQSTLAPEAFTIAWPPGFDGSPEQSAADSMFRGWLVAAGVDRETGDSLASIAAERITDLEKVGDRSNAHVESERILRDVYREQFQPRIDGAIRLVDHIESTQPGFAEFLQRTGLGNDATFVHRLATIAEQMGI